LLRLCGDKSEGQIEINLPLDKHFLAGSLAMKPETFSRALQSLRDVGVTALGEQVTIHHIEDLKRYVCDHCSDLGICGE
jgi:CRP-like cAMP-binding protein